MATRLLFRAMPPARSYRHLYYTTLHISGDVLLIYFRRAGLTEVDI